MRCLYSRKRNRLACVALAKSTIVGLKRREPRWKWRELYENCVKRTGVVEWWIGGLVDWWIGFALVKNFTNPLRPYFTGGTFPGLFQDLFYEENLRVSHFQWPYRGK